MYFKLLLRKVLYIQPADLTATVHRDIEGFLRAEVEGTRIPDVGLVIALCDIKHTSDGKILDNGNVTFELHYHALVHKFFSGETMDVQVVHVDREGISASAGAGTVFISKLHIAPDYVFESDHESVSIFVKKDGTQGLRQGDIVRVKIIAEMPTSDKFSAMGTMIGPFLGPRN
jgi:DNA-directed RNA polymerase II subunit RPB7